MKNKNLLTMGLLVIGGVMLYRHMRSKNRSAVLTSDPANGGDMSNCSGCSGYSNIVGCDTPECAPCHGAGCSDEACKKLGYQGWNPTLGSTSYNGVCYGGSSSSPVYPTTSPMKRFMQR